MSSTPECVTKTPEIEAREKLAAIFSDAEQRGDNSKVSPELGKTAIDIEKVAINQKPIENNAKSSFADYRNKLNNLDAYPTKIPLEIGNLLAELRKAKANEVQ